VFHLGAAHRCKSEQPHRHVPIMKRLDRPRHLALRFAQANDEVRGGVAGMAAGGLLDEMQAPRPISSFEAAKGSLAGRVQSKADVIHSGGDQLAHMIHRRRENGRIQRDVGGGFDSLDDGQGALVIALPGRNLEAAAADRAALDGPRQMLDCLCQGKLGPGDAGEVEGAGAAGARLGAKSTGHAAPAAQHQVGSGGGRVHGHIGQAQHSGGAYGNINLVHCHGTSCPPNCSSRIAQMSSHR